MRIQKYSFNSLENEILWFPSLASTNDTAKELAEAGHPEGTCVIADEQTRGRGRHGRTWHSPSGEALYLSLLLRPTLHPEKLQLLTVLTAIAAAETASEFGNSHSIVDIKWPNDLLINDKKVCGILVESGFEGNKIKYAIVGIGFNLNQNRFPIDLGDSATSLRLQTGCEYDREEFAVRLVGNIGKGYLALQRGESQQVISRLGELSSFVTGKPVTIDMGNDKITGTTCGVTDTGSLRIRRDSGDVIVINSGEIVKLRS